jgi:hypothetical protein
LRGELRAFVQKPRRTISSSRAKRPASADEWSVSFQVAVR